jgi:hypothetical protein
MSAPRVKESGRTHAHRTSSRGRFAGSSKNATTEGAVQSVDGALTRRFLIENGADARRMRCERCGASVAILHGVEAQRAFGFSSGFQTSKEETTMKNVLTKTVLMLALAVTAGAPAAFAKAKKPKHSADHVAAVKKCGDDYNAALKSAKSLKANERKGARAKAKQDRKQCLADAPQ